MSVLCSVVALSAFQTGGLRTLMFGVWENVAHKVPRYRSMGLSPISFQLSA